VSKADLKGSQLPVTDPAPYVCEPIPAGHFPDVLPVLDKLGGFLFWADEDLARSLVRKHQVRICRTKNKVRALQALQELTAIKDEKRCSMVKFFGIPNRRETEENPARVWTQDKMGHSSMRYGDDKRAVWSRKACREVVTSCLKQAA
jgi:hypothetical protein